MNTTYKLFSDLQKCMTLTSRVYIFVLGSVIQAPGSWFNNLPVS